MNQRTVSATEYEAVAKIANQYVEAVRVGNVDMLVDIFHKNAIAYGTVDGKLVGGTSNPAIDFIEKYGKSTELVSHIDVLDITPTTAVVRILMEKDAIESDCNGYLTLIKLDTGWTVIAKVFHQFDKK